MQESCESELEHFAREVLDVMRDHVASERTFGNSSRFPNLSAVRAETLIDLFVVAKKHGYMAGHGDIRFDFEI